METHPLTVAADEMISDVASRLGTPESPWHDVRLIPVTDTDGSLLAVISRADIFAALAAAPETSVLDAGVRQPITVHADDLLSEAVDRMILHGIGRLPVTDRSSTPRLIGLLTRRAILDAKHCHQQLERLRPSVKHGIISKGIKESN